MKWHVLQDRGRKKRKTKSSRRENDRNTVMRRGMKYASSEKFIVIKKCKMDGARNESSHILQALPIVRIISTCLGILETASAILLGSLSNTWHSMIDPSQYWNSKLEVSRNNKTALIYIKRYGINIFPGNSWKFTHTLIRKFAGSEIFCNALKALTHVSSIRYTQNTNSSKQRLILFKGE